MRNIFKKGNTVADVVANFTKAIGDLDNIVIDSDLQIMKRQEAINELDEEIGVLEEEANRASAISDKLRELIS